MLMLILMIDLHRRPLLIINYYDNLLLMLLTMLTMLTMLAMLLI